MNKKFKNLFLAGALVLGLAGVAVSCTDYDDDINKLQTDTSALVGQVNTLQGTVSELQNKINAGYVITAVAPLSGEPGGWEFTTSDGKKYNVTNGAKGADGAPGAPGAPGNDGKDGKDGKDGIWFTPDATTGTWVKHEIVDGEEVTTDTEQSILPDDFIDVVFDADSNTLTLKVGDKEYEIKLAGGSASLVFVPEAVVDGINALEIRSFTSHIYVTDPETLDSEEEGWTPALFTTGEETVKAYRKWLEDNEVVLSTYADEQAAYLDFASEIGLAVKESVPAVAKYHVNYDLPLDDSFEYTVLTKDTPVYTRVESSDDFGMSAKFKSFENGVLSVEVSYVGTPASVDEQTNHLTQFAVQVSKGDKVYTSDYATFVVKDIVAPRIADPIDVVKKTEGKAAKLADSNYEEHYRRGTAGIGYKDDGANFGDYDDTGYHEYFAAQGYVAPWVMSEFNSDEGIAQAHATCDTTVAYDETLDLATITIPHYVANGQFCFKAPACCDATSSSEPTETPSRDVEYAVATRADAAPDNCLEMSAAEMEEFGLHFEYEVVKNFITGKPETDQADFVELVDGHIFKPRVYETDGTAAIGRTPIIRVKLMHGEDIINVAYIKVFIAAASTIVPQIELTPRRDYLDDDSDNVFGWGCDGDSLFTTVHDMNVYLYNPLHTDKKTFHVTYDSLRALPAMKDAKNKDLTLGTIEDVVLNPVEGTHIIKWTLSPAELWDYAGKEVSVIAEYFNKKSPDVAVRILLKATVDNFAQSVSLTHEANYTPNYWTAGYEATLYNVLPPAQGDTIADHAQMILDINASFETDKYGKVILDKAKNVVIDSMAYFFCKKDVEAISKIGDLNVKFFVTEENDGEISLLKGIIFSDEARKKAVTDTEVVAVIANGLELADIVSAVDELSDPDLKLEPTNTFWWVKGESVADTLINTKEMYTFIGANAFLCTDVEDAEIKPLPVTYDGKDHFRANIIRPVDITTTSAEGFVDAVNFGEPGSYIKIEDLLDPIDWRKYRFVTEYDSKKNPIAGKDNAFLWKYYGPFTVVIDTDNVETDLGGSRGPLKTTLFVEQTPAGETEFTPSWSTVSVTLPENESGFLTYKNNGVNVTADFNLYVKAKVSYGFGYIDTDWITVPVAKTINQESSSAADGE